MVVPDSYLNKAKEALGNKIESSLKLPYNPRDCVGEGMNEWKSG